MEAPDSKLPDPACVSNPGNHEATGSTTVLVETSLTPTLPSATSTTSSTPGNPWPKPDFQQSKILAALAAEKGQLSTRLTRARQNRITDLFRYRFKSALSNEISFFNLPRYE
jgi:hypothetical protein